MTTKKYMARPFVDDPPVIEKLGGFKQAAAGMSDTLKDFARTLDAGADTLDLKVALLLASADMKRASEAVHKARGHVMKLRDEAVARMRKLRPELFKCSECGGDCPDALPCMRAGTIAKCVRCVGSGVVTDDSGEYGFTKCPECKSGMVAVQLPESK